MTICFPPDANGFGENLSPSGEKKTTTFGTHISKSARKLLINMTADMTDD